MAAGQEGESGRLGGFFRNTCTAIGGLQLLYTHRDSEWSLAALYFKDPHDVEEIVYESLAGPIET